MLVKTGGEENGVICGGCIALKIEDDDGSDMGGDSGAFLLLHGSSVSQRSRFLSGNPMELSASDAFAMASSLY